MTIEIDIEGVLVDDDASNFKDNLGIAERQALFHPNGLVEGETGLTEKEREEIEHLLSPDRPSFDEALKSVL